MFMSTPYSAQQNVIWSAFLASLPAPRPPQQGRFKSYLVYSEGGGFHVVISCSDYSRKTAGGPASPRGVRGGRSGG